MWMAFNLQKTLGRLFVIQAVFALELDGTERPANGKGSKVLWWLLLILLFRSTTTNKRRPIEITWRFSVLFKRKNINWANCWTRTIRTYGHIRPGLHHAPVHVTRPEKWPAIKKHDVNRNRKNERKNIRNHCGMSSIFFLSATSCVRNRCRRLT